MHGIIIVLFFVISVVLGVAYSPLAQIVWLCVASLGYVSIEKVFSHRMRKAKVPQVWVAPLTKQKVYFN
ncbi:MAG TPA: hypothetical protein VEC36_11320 [Patescibacteria group bacterium]|nr:hypothetical protein [Patescibacteria group bacterium]